MSMKYSETESLRALQFVFAQKQNERVADKQAEGKDGWDREGNISHLEKRLRERVGGDLKDIYNLIDIANICMFLWNFRRRGK